MRTDASATDTAAVIAQVLAVDVHACGWLVIQTDRRLDTARVIWAGAELMSRRSRARVRRCLLVRRPSRIDITLSTDVVVAYLPVDVRMGDLLSLPARASSRQLAQPPSRQPKIS